MHNHNLLPRRRQNRAQKTDKRKKKDDPINGARTEKVCVEKNEPNPVGTRGDDMEERSGSLETNELPDPGVGTGPCWNLPVDQANTSKGKGLATKRCEILLEQALSCSKHADMRFVFDDGESLLSGHWGMLCATNEVFEAMHSYEMKEARTQEVRIVGISRESFRGVLEWLYLGYAGKEMAGADGREVWLLAERYQIDGVKEWLMEKALDSSSLYAAAQYALEGEGEGREELLLASRLMVSSTMKLSAVDEGCLRGLSAYALRELLEGHRYGGDGVLEGERGMERFRLVERWARANGVYECVGRYQDEVCGLIDAVDPTKLPSEFICKVFRTSEIVSDAFKLQNASVMGVGSVSLHHVKFLEFTGGAAKHCLDLRHIAVGGGSEGERLAVADAANSCVVVFDLKTGEIVLHVGRDADPSGRFDAPYGVAFNKRGDLLVSNWHSHSIHVFDRQGLLLCAFGSAGVRDDEFYCPSGIAVNSQGHIIVCDHSHHCIKVFDEEGKFIRKFGSRGTRKGKFFGPVGLAVGIDDSIVVAEERNARVQVFSPLGMHVMTVGSQGEGRGQFISPFGVCVGLEGEIVVSDTGRGYVQVFTKEGKLMQCIGRGGDSDCDIHASCVAVDAQGRLFVGDKRDCNVAMLAMRVK